MLPAPGPGQLLALHSPLSCFTLSPGLGRRARRVLRAPAVSSPSFSGRSWLAGDPGASGQAGHRHPSLGTSLHLCKADLEERPGALWRWAENCWDQLGPLLPSQGVYVLHLVKHKLCGVQPHCLVTGAFLTIRGAHLCPKRLGE